MSNAQNWPKVDRGITLRQHQGGTGVCMKAKAKRLLGMLSTCCAGVAFLLTLTPDFHKGVVKVVAIVFGVLLGGLLLSLPAQPDEWAKGGRKATVTVMLLAAIWLIFFPTG